MKRFIVLIGEDPRTYHTDDEQQVKKWLQNEDFVEIIDTEDDEVWSHGLGKYVPVQELPDFAEPEDDDDDEF